MKNTLFTIFLLVQFLFSYSQFWNRFGGNNIATTEFIGSDALSLVPLSIRTNSNHPIDFWTNNTPQMSLRTDGNLNLINGSNGYWINNNPILWHNGNNTRLYVGVGAGNTTSGASNNTFVGNNAGSSITGGDNNTFVGTFSGRFNSSGVENSCFGALAGNAITTGARNTMLGSSANPSVNNLDYATAVGAFSTVSQSNSLVLGAIEGLNGAPSNTSVGIGTPEPISVLHLNRNTATPVFTRFTNSNAPNTSLSNGGLEVGLAASGIGVIRHLSDFPIQIWTSSGSPPTNPRINSTFTSNFTFGGIGSLLNTQGDGLRIHDPNNIGGDLDLWTSGSNQSHIVWGPNGRIQGVNNRLEIQADFTNGLWLNVTNPNTGTFFNRQASETGRIGSNTFWRIGANAGNLNANRRLEVVDADNPQLRLTQATTSDVNINQGTRTDFQTTNTGNLFINPRNGGTGANVGINVAAPTSRLHISSDANLASALQITNVSGTGQAVGDGLRMGYAATTATNREAFINQQENDRLSLFSNNGERMRITQTNALNNGVAFNPGGLAANFTRIGISHNPATPVTRPLSLLHLGYNTEALLGGENGWRPWMDVGMFVSNQSDHVYLGLKAEGADRQDAVLSWGDNQINAGASGAGPENFRIIFSSSQNPIAQGVAPATGVNGLEGFRMTPFLNLTDLTDVGIRTGIGGDPTSNLYFGTSANPTSTLEVNAWGSSPTTANGALADPIFGGTPTGRSGLRFTDLSSASIPQLNPGQGVLSLDGDGDVVYVPASTAPAIGNYCNAPQQPLQNNFEIPLNGHRYSFTAGNTANNLSSVNIGDVTCATQQPARLYVVLDKPMGASASHVAIGAEVLAASLPPNTPQYAVAGIIRNSNSPLHAGVVGLSANGIHDKAIGVLGRAYDCNQLNIGVQALATGSVGTNIGVESWANGVNSKAGLFMGDVDVNGVLNINGSGFINSV